MDRPCALRDGFDLIIAFPTFARPMRGARRRLVVPRDWIDSADGPIPLSCARLAQRSIQCVYAARRTIAGV